MSHTGIPKSPARRHSRTQRETHPPPKIAGPAGCTPIYQHRIDITVIRPGMKERKQSVTLPPGHLHHPQVQSHAKRNTPTTCQCASSLPCPSHAIRSCQSGSKEREKVSHASVFHHPQLSMHTACNQRMTQSPPAEAEFYAHTPAENES